MACSATMLLLLDAPGWRGADGSLGLVPCTVPGALLLRLAAENAWVDREGLAAAFWPDRPGTAGLQVLRLNLSRLRGLLDSWGRSDALQAERQRVALRLPTDLQAFAAAVDAADPDGLAAQTPWRWLSGFRLPGFEAFRSWAEAEALRLNRQWDAAAERSLLAAADGRADAQAAHALMQTWRGQRPQAAKAVLQRLRNQRTDAEALWQALAEPSPEEIRASSEAGATEEPAPLPGRTADLARLRALTTRVRLVVGEAGIGKTSLVAAAFPGAPRLRAREGLETLSLSPVAEWLRLNRSRISLAPAYRLDLARLLPDIAAGEALPPLDAHTARLRLNEALAQVFEAAGQVLIVDDLQWCDSATLEWLVFLAHRGSLRWIATARPHEMPAPVRQALRALQSAGLSSELALEGLPSHAIRLLCQERWPAQAWPAERTQRLWRRSGGNPFFALELVSTQAEDGSDELAPPRVLDLVQRRLASLAPTAQAAVAAAALLGRPVGLAVLAHAARAAPAIDDFVPACEQAVGSGLLTETAGGLECAHDMIRSAVLATLSVPRRQWLHRRAALALGASADPFELAMHWEAAGEPQTALAWLHQGALRLKERGRHEEARAHWQRVSGEATEPALALRARLALAECELFDDLESGRQALESTLDEVASIADPVERDQLLGQALAGLVDNRVFAGDQARARQLAPRLRELLPRLDTAVRLHAHEVLMELAMREPDIDEALALLAQSRRLAPNRPALLSFEGQIHWFGGRVREARATLEQLLLRHPDYCRGLTIENDIAVMCHALGDLATAETMARRSLLSWQGVAHTETLSLLVLGSIATSAGRWAEAGEALGAAEQLAHRQSSSLFLSEVRIRRARLSCAMGRHAAALEEIVLAEELVREDDNPLRYSHLVQVQVTAGLAAGSPPPARYALALAALCRRSGHPLVHARAARVDAELALAEGDAARAAEAAARAAVLAREAGLQELLADALLLRVRAQELPGSEPTAETLGWADEAEAIAGTIGSLDLAWRAGDARYRHGAGAEAARSAALALAALQQASPPQEGFDAVAAAGREPRVLHVHAPPP